MKKLFISCVTRVNLTRLLLLFCTNLWCSRVRASTTNTRELLRGFTAALDPSESFFQPILSDNTGNYSLGFLRVKSTQLALAIIHVPSSERVWSPTNQLARWSGSAQLLFNGSLVVTDKHTGVFWSSFTNGDRVWLSNMSNLVIGAGHVPLWQSFQFPFDTLMENQNFTSAMVLSSSDGHHYMQLGSDYMGLYAEFRQGPGQIYWKHRAMEAKAEVIEGQGPIHAVLSGDGFLGMYQNGSVPVDVQPFNSFQQPGSGNRRVRLETDGNLRGYYWTGSNWILDYLAISETCELPSACGPYGLCQPGKGCSCLNNKTVQDSGKCDTPVSSSGDFCGAGGDKKHRVLRRSGVDLPYKELMGYEKMESLENCENACEVNCTCWGTVYSNSSGFCYMLDYPIQTLVGVGDDTKVGYFKVRESAGKSSSRMDVGVGVGVGLLCGVILIIVVVLGLGWYRYYYCSRSKRGVVGGYGEEEDGAAGVGPYKEMGSASFRSIELCER